MLLQKSFITKFIYYIYMIFYKLYQVKWGDKSRFAKVLILFYAVIIWEYVDFYSEKSRFFAVYLNPVIMFTCETVRSSINVFLDILGFFEDNFPYTN